MLTDTHAHLYWEKFNEDLDKVLQRAIDANVTNIINVGVDAEKSKIALTQVEKVLSQVKGLESFSSIGIHPHEAVKYANNPDVSIHVDLEKLEEIHKSNPQKVVLVGECGLD